MQINLTDFLYQDEALTNKKYKISIETISFGKSQAKLPEGIDLELQLQRTGPQEILLIGSVQTVLLLTCDRCNEPVRYPLITEFSKDIRVDVDHEDDEVYLEGNILLLEQLAKNEVLLNFPMKILCKEDCMGICLQCGTNLNKETCHCKNEQIDPRLSGLKDLFDEHFKEV